MRSLTRRLDRRAPADQLQAINEKKREGVCVCKHVCVCVCEGECKRAASSKVNVAREKQYTSTYGDNPKAAWYTNSIGTRTYVQDAQK